MAQKDGHSELRISLPDTDKESLRQVAKKSKNSGGMSGLAAEFIQQGLGKRKLGDYVHEQAYEQSVASKDREIAGLKKKADAEAAIWGDVVISLGMQDDLRETIKNIPAWCLERVDFIIEALNTATEKNEEYEKQIQSLQETTIQRSEHEERIDTVSKEKQEIQTQLQAETESVKRLNVKITEQASEIQSLKVEKGRQEEKIEGLQGRLEVTRSNEKDWKKAYTELLERSWWQKLLDIFTGIKPSSLFETEPKETPPRTKTDDDIPS